MALKYSFKPRIFLKCMFEFMINIAPLATNSAYGVERYFKFINFLNFTDLTN